MARPLCEGFVAYDEAMERRRPCVLVAHSWAGQSANERAVATELARQGYVGFALDVYGTGVRGGLWDDNSALMQPFMEDRALLRRRLHAGCGKRPICFVGALGRALNVQAVRLARSSRAPPRIWTFLRSLRSRSAFRARELVGAVTHDPDLGEPTVARLHGDDVAGGERRHVRPGHGQPGVVLGAQEP
jgi:Dienelactone hydrolase family